jgi:hypothetical protein
MAMFGTLTALSRSTRPYLPRFKQQKFQARGLALTHFTDGESYWKDTPWSNTPVEEFNTYRWQVRGLRQFFRSPSSKD